MKIRASVTIAQESLEALDRYVSNDNSRSSLVQEAIDAWLVERRRKERHERNARDVRILSKDSEAFNRDLEDALSYQADLDT